MYRESRDDEVAAGNCGERNTRIYKQSNRAGPAPKPRMGPSRKLELRVAHFNWPGTRTLSGWSATPEEIPNFGPLWAQLRHLYARRQTLKGKGGTIWENPMEQTQPMEPRSGPCETLKSTRAHCHCVTPKPPKGGWTTHLDLGEGSGRLSKQACHCLLLGPRETQKGP